MPKLSIIVPVYKVEQYINKCIDSILNQTFTDFELILVDDGSPDNCGKICDEYAQKDKRVRVIHKENGGVSSARNLGIDEVKGEYIGFVDSDDFIDANMYQEMLDFLEVNDLDIVCTDTYVVHGDRKKFRPRYLEDKIFENGTAITENLNGNLDNAVWNKIYKKKMIADIRFPLNRRFEDVATVYKWIFNARKVGYLSKPHYYYRKLDSSFIGTSFNPHNRYEHFVGYKERYEFSKKNNLECINDCELLALEAALAALTVFYANDEVEISERFINVSKFIDEHSISVRKDKMRSRNKFLIWCNKHCNRLHKIYAKMSAVSKQMRLCLKFR